MIGEVIKIAPYFNQRPVLTDVFDGETAVIIGSSLYAKREAFECIEKEKNPHIVGINDSPLITGIRPDHWMSLHGDRIPAWLNMFEAMYKSPVVNNCITHSTNYSQFVDTLWMLSSLGGGSVGLAVIACAYMGYKRIILCGCPMDDTPRATNYLIGCEHSHQKYTECLSFFFSHRGAIKSLGVRSMSGKTAKIFGRPW